MEMTRREKRRDGGDCVLAYGLVGNDVPAGGEAHAGAVPQRGRCGACGGAVAAKDAGPHRGQPPCHLSTDLSLSLTLRSAPADVVSSREVALVVGGVVGGRSN